VLTHQQILYFTTFGYVTLRGLFSQSEMAALRAEVTGALADAFGQIGTEPGESDGISGDYLPLSVDRAPFSQSLIADDERTFLVSAELLGGPTVPSVGIATCFTGDSSWHTRLGPAIPGVTIWVDLDRRTAGTGALRLVPGSHIPEYERRVWAYSGAEPDASGFEQPDWPDWPHVVVETEPGDAVAFHSHLFNCAGGGTPRLTWTIDYLAWPGLGDADRMRLVRDLTLDDVEYDDYDQRSLAGLARVGRGRRGRRRDPISQARRRTPQAARRPNRRLTLCNAGV
jgi:Phytanoyl-CoA dioxygenase (PhyH)